MDDNELQQYLLSLQERMRQKIDGINQVQGELDMTMILLEAVTERTENFREYFFSRKLIDDKRREALSVIGTVDIADPESSFTALDAVTKNLEELLALAKSEVNRLDT